jgi:hypothetical protein
MAFILGANGADQFCVRINQQTQRIGIEGNMRTVFLGVGARRALPLLRSVKGRVDFLGRNR